MALALAAEVLVLTPEGPLVPGEPSPLQIVVTEAGRPVPAARVSVVSPGARVVANVVEVSPGRYVVPVDAAAAGTVPLTVRVGDTAFPASVIAAVRARSISDPPPLDTPAGADRIEVRFPLLRPVDRSLLVARVTEGRVVEVVATATEAVVVIEPGPSDSARCIGVGLLDRALPGGAPAFALVRVRARQSARVNVGVGSTVTIRVGRRSYGPFAADDAGMADIAFDVLPGEETFEILATDDLGNSRRVPSPLPSGRQPVLLAMDAAVPGSLASQVTLGAWGAAGQPWDGAAPVCRTGVGGREDAARVSSGRFRYRVAPPANATLDLRVECALETASAVLRVPTGSTRPERIDLRVYPEALSADFPLAEVQASLVDGRGDRVPAEGLVLSADRGMLTTEAVGGVVRGEYEGADAVASGGDVLRAAWRPAPATGAPWSLDLFGAPGTAGLDLRFRARDRRGDPLIGVPVRVESGSLVVESVTGAGGWGVAVLGVFGPAPVRVSARAGDVTRDIAVIPLAPDALPDIGAPDLAAAIELPIRAGTVRSMFIDVAPRPLPTGGGQVAVVEVRLLDAAGNPVRNEAVRITADSGTIAQPQARPDGSFAAVYTPPPGAVAGNVAISAAAGGGSVTTDLALVPQAVRGSFGLGVGWVSNFGAVSSPVVDVVLSNGLPGIPRLLQARVGVSTYALAAEVPDTTTNESVVVRALFIPVEVGVQGIQRQGRRVLDAGIGLVLLPYTLTAAFGGETGVAGGGFGPPGIVVHAGGGFRLGGSELFGEARYLLATPRTGAVSFQGSVGGGSIVAGYRVLY